MKPIFLIALGSPSAAAFSNCSRAVGVALRRAVAEEAHAAELSDRLRIAGGGRGLEQRPRLGVIAGRIERAAELVMHPRILLVVDDRLGAELQRVPRDDVAVNAAHVGRLVDVKGIGRGAVALGRDRLGLVEHRDVVAAEAVGEAADARRRRPSRLRQHHIGAQRGMIPRNLRLLGGRRHVAAHALHQAADFDVRRLHVLQQRRGERAVAAAAVERDVVGLGGEHDQRVDRALHLRQPDPVRAVRVSSVRLMVLSSGLSRQASRNTRLTRWSFSICPST